MIVAASVATRSTSMPALRISSTNARASTLNSLLPAGSSMVSRIGFPSRSRTPSASLSR